MTDTTDTTDSTDSITLARQLVLARLGSPAAQLPGESYRHRAADSSRIYERWGEWVDESFMHDRPKQALESFVAFLEAERETNYEAFDYGRELLLADLPVYIDYPSTDAEPPPIPALRGLVGATAPKWSRRKPSHTTVEQLRARVLEQLGQPPGCLPGECVMLTSNPALNEVSGYLQQIEYQPITEHVVNDAIERLSAMRGRDWQAFCYGRDQLLSLLPVTLERPQRTAPSAAMVG